MSNYLMVAQYGQDRDVLVNMDNVLFITPSPNHDGSEIWFGFPIFQMQAIHGEDGKVATISNVPKDGYMPCVEVEEAVFALEKRLSARRERCK